MEYEAYDLTSSSAVFDKIMTQAAGCPLATRAAMSPVASQCLVRSQGTALLPHDMQWASNYLGKRERWYEIPALKVTDVLPMNILNRTVTTCSAFIH